MSRSAVCEKSFASSYAISYHETNRPTLSMRFHEWNINDMTQLSVRFWLALTLPKWMDMFESVGRLSTNHHCHRYTQSVTTKWVDRHFRPCSINGLHTTRRSVKFWDDFQITGWMDMFQSVRRLYKNDNFSPRWQYVLRQWVERHCRPCSMKELYIIWLIIQLWLELPITDSVDIFESVGQPA